MATVLVPCTSVAGTWSHESFGNDGALDWVSEFQAAPGADLLRTTLNAAAGAKYLESPEAEAAVAAAEVVAASLGRPSRDFPKELLPVVARFKAQFRELAPLARAAIANVLGPKSELRENWSGPAGGTTRWRGGVEDLLKRLQ